MWVLFVLVEGFSNGGGRLKEVTFVNDLFYELFIVMIPFY